MLWVVAGAPVALCVSLIGYLVVADTATWREARRRRACPVCKSKRLTQLQTYQWAGLERRGMAHAYRCETCQAELFGEQGGAPMPMADQAAWLAANQATLSEYPRRDPDFPTAEVIPPGDGPRRGHR
jgi:DNA-directed RNA polymerase subunit RPC12/RpoP